MRPRRTKRVLVGVALLGTVITFFALRGPGANDPTLLSLIPDGLELVPRSRFYSKPWFSIPWFGGSAISIPAETEMPPKWVDDPNKSGFFTWLPKSTVSAYGSAAKPVPRGAGRTIAAAAFLFSCWTSEAGHRYYLPYSGNTVTSVAPCPYIFGTSRQRFKVTFEDSPTLEMNVGYKPQPFEIELPPNGQPAPQLGSASLKVGKATIEITPAPWIGPLFEPTFIASAVGLEKDEALLVIATEKDNELQGVRTLVLSGSDTAEFATSSKWISMEIHLAKVKDERISVRHSVGGRVEVRDSKGGLLKRGKSSSRDHVSWEEGSKSVPTEVEGAWQGVSYNLPSAASYMAYWGRGFMGMFPLLRPGTYEGRTYRLGAKWKFEVKGLVPNGLATQTVEGPTSVPSR